MRQRLFELLRTFRQLLRLDHARARLPLYEAGVLEQGPVEPEERRRAFDAELRGCCALSRNPATGIKCTEATGVSGIAKVLECVPEGMEGKTGPLAALVVALHGYTQTADEYRATTECGCPSRSRRLSTVAESAIGSSTQRPSWSDSWVNARSVCAR